MYFLSLAILTAFSWSLKTYCFLVRI